MPNVELKIHTQYTPNQYPINLEHHTVFYYWGYHSKQIATSILQNSIMWKENE